MSDSNVVDNSKRTSLAAMAGVGLAVPLMLSSKDTKAALNPDSGVVNVISDYGASGDGVTDDTTAFQNAINTGKTVVVPNNKTYKLTTLIPHSSGHIRLRPEAYSSDFPVLEPVNLGTDICMDWSSNVGATRICDVEGIAFHGWSVVARSTSGSIVVNFNRNKIYNGGAKGILFDCNVTEANVHYNQIYNLDNSTNSTQAITLGERTGTRDVSTGMFFVSNNVIKGLNTNKTGGGECHGIITRGFYAKIFSNHIEDVSSPNNVGNGAEAIYCNTRFGEITHNTIVDGGSGQGCITVKGNKRGETIDAAYAIEIAFNKIEGTGQNCSVGIGIFTGDTYCHHNIIEGVQYIDGYTIGDASGIFVNPGNVNNVRVEHNELYNIQTTKGINFRGRGNKNSCSWNRIHYVGHVSVIAQASGIWMELNGDSYQFRIEGNDINYADSILTSASNVVGIKWVATTYSHSGLSIKNNTINFSGTTTANKQGIVIDGDSAQEFVNAHVIDNIVLGNYSSQWNGAPSAGTYTECIEMLNSWNTPTGSGWNTVTAGAQDSGGTGYRLLRMSN